MRLLELLAPTLIGLGLLSFALQKRFWGVPPVIFEVAGVAVLWFLQGYRGGSKLLLLLFSAIVVLAAIVDPYLWSLRGITYERARIDSLIYATAMGVIIPLAYLLGARLRNL